MSIFERFKAVRKATGLNQTDFGKEIGVSRDVIANIEVGRIELKDIHRLAVCRRFNVNEDWLLTGEGDMMAPLSRDQEIARISAQLFKDNDPIRMQLFELVSGMSEKELTAAKIIRDYVVKKFEDK